MADDAKEIKPRRQATVRFSSDLDHNDRETIRNEVSALLQQKQERSSLRSRLFRRTSHAASIPEDIPMETARESIFSVAGDLSSEAQAPKPVVAVERDKAFNVKKIPLQTQSQSLPFYSQYALRYAKSPTFSSIRRFVHRLKVSVFHLREYQPDPQGRLIAIDATHPGQLERRTQKPYIKNGITSSRYSPYDFLPRQLAFQFSKVANIYFLSISILQMIPGLSTTGTYTTIIPLAIFIMIAIGREGYDDLRRHRMDRVENNKTCFILTKGSDNTYKWQERKWQDIEVGHIIKLEKDEWVPADVVLLHSTGQNDIAFVETAALDGETNLKPKRCIGQVAQCCSDISAICNFRSEIHCEAPNQDLYTFEGRLHFEGVEIPLTNDQILYRGSILRNTSTVFALAIFTGEESKIRLNASKIIRIKRPSMQSKVNRIVIAIVIFVLCLSIFCTSGYYIWHSNTEVHLWYLGKARKISFLPIFVSFIILFNTMVPLSLYVSMEIVKLIQQVLLEQDIDMYHEESNTPMEARTSTINEELGQVSYIFSDKTGTLTDNEMVFRKLTIAGHAWLHDLDIQRDALDERPFLIHKLRKGKKKTTRRTRTIATADPSRSNSFASLRHAKRQPTVLPRPSVVGQRGTEGARKDLPSTIDMLHYIQSNPHTVFSRRARQFLLAIALCHTALPEYDCEDELPRFSAASPDELALVNAALELGYIVTDRAANTITLKTFPNGATGESQFETYEILDVIEFSSLRKRMSLIVRLPNGRINIFCKGADSFILDRLRLKELGRRKWEEVERQARLRQSAEAEIAISRKSMSRPSISRPSISAVNRLDMLHDLDRYLESRRDVENDADEVGASRRSMQYARHSLAYGEPKSPIERGAYVLVDEDLANDEAITLEHTFQHLQGFAAEGLRVLMYGHREISASDYANWKKLYHDAMTSLTDRQAKVEQIAEMIEVEFELTGATAIEDKLQEGVPQTLNKLRRAGIKLWMLTGDKRETAINIGHSAGLVRDYSTVIILSHTDEAMANIMAERALEIRDGVIAHSAVVVDGATLSYIEDDLSLQTLFLELVLSADTVICCRASPAQKALLVQHVRKEVKNSITLAIGDGANDIAMIREAHVGIGLTGKEGLQAARSSDYSIAQFRFLSKLLLVHGRWNYIRIAKYTLGTFYKELLLFLTQAVYQRFAGYTGTSLHENWSLSFFNTLFSSLAVIVLGSTEKDLSAATLLAVPELYETGRLGKAFNLRLFVGWALLAACQAVLSFYVAYAAYGLLNARDLYAFGNIIFSAIVIVVNVKLLFFEMHSWSIVNYSAFLITFTGWWMWCLGQSFIFKHEKIYLLQHQFTKGFGTRLNWWASLFVTTICLLFIDLVFQTCRACFMPTEEDTFRELQADTAGKARLEEEAAQELQAGWQESQHELEIRQILASRDNPSSGQVTWNESYAPTPEGKTNKKGFSSSETEMIV